MSYLQNVILTLRAAFRSKANRESDELWALPPLVRQVKRCAKRVAEWKGCSRWCSSCGAQTVFDDDDPELPAPEDLCEELCFQCVCKNLAKALEELKTTPGGYG